MGSLLSYSGLTTKLRSMESHLIGDEGYRSISELVSVGEVVSFLKKEPAYREIFANFDEDNFRRGDVERLLNESIYMGFARIYRFANQEQRKFLRLYFKRYEVSVMKRCFRLVSDHRAPAPELWRFEGFFKRHSQLDLDKLGASRSMGELIENLRGTEYFEPLSKLTENSGATLFDYEMALDMYYFAQIWKQKDKICRKQDLKSLGNAYGAKFDMINLDWICRTKKFYRLSAGDVYAMLIPVNHKLSREEIIRLVEAPSMDDFAALLEKTYYGRKYQELSVSTLEDMYVHVLKNTLRQEAGRHPYSVAMIYSYLYQKEHEVDRLTTALECIRYGLEPSVTYQHIVRN